MRHWRLAKIPLFLLGWTASTALADSDECKLSDKTGRYNLSPLRKATDYKVKNPINGEVYAVNFCGPIVTSTWAVDRADQIGAYYESGHGGVSLGKFNVTPSNANGHLALSYKDGSSCQGSGGKRSAVFLLKCDTSWSTYEPTFVTSVDECAYVFEFKTPHACPASFVGSIWTAIGVFLVFVATAILVSVVSTVVYNRLVLNRRGMDQFPSAEKLREWADIVKDLIVISGIWFLDTVQNAFTKLHSIRGSASYQRPAVDYSRGAWSRSAADNFSTGGVANGGHPQAPTSDEVPHGVNPEDRLPPGPAGFLDDSDDDDDEEDTTTEKGKGTNPV
ncbi:mannose 6-phosphate receptor domain-containing protein [Meredithblackwellia eburnea MCA 4105]